MRQFAGFGTAEDTNERYKFLLERGQTGLSVAFDFPTLMGYDSDHPRSEGEVGKCGVAISSLADMETLFDGIPLDKVSTSMTINGPAAMLFCFYVAAAEKQGVADRPSSRGRSRTTSSRSTWRSTPGSSRRSRRSRSSWTSSSGRRSTPRSGTRSRSRGITSGRRERPRRRSSPSPWPTGSATWSTGSRGGCTWTASRRGSRSSGTSTTTSSRRSPSSAPRGGSGPGTCATATAPGTSAAGRCASTARRPASRSPRSSRRTTSCGWRTRPWPRCWAAPSRSTPTRWTRRWRCPTEESVRVALRTQQILAYETGVPNVADPLGGSYYVEALTDALEREAEGLFAEIEAQGGVVQAIESGWFQRQIAQSSMRFQSEVEQQRRTVVGVNDFVEEEEAPVEILKVGDEAEQTQRARLARLREQPRRRAGGRTTRGAPKRRGRRSQHHPGDAGLRACVLHALRDPACAGGDIWQLSRAGFLLIGRGETAPPSALGCSGSPRWTPDGIGWSRAIRSWSPAIGAAASTSSS